MAQPNTTAPHSAPRRVAALVGVAVLLLTLTGALAVPRPAQAFLGLGDVTFDVNQLATWVWEKAKSAVSTAWQHAGAIAYRNAVRTFSQKLAYDTAVSLSSGGPGQTPLFTWKSLGQNTKDAFDSAAGDFLETLNQKNGYIKLGLCQPLSPAAKNTINQVLLANINPPKPKCTLSTILKNLPQAVRNPKFLADFQSTFNASQSDLGIVINLSEGQRKLAQAQSDLSLSESTSAGGFLSVKEPISGGIKTPALAVAQQSAVASQTAAQEYSAPTGDVLADALGIFTNTLASRLLKRLLQQGLVPHPSSVGSAGGSPGSPGFGLGGTSGGVEYAVQVNSSISTPQLVGSENVDIISELASCPDDPKFAPPNACTINSKFEQLLRKANEGTALTLQEAFDQGYFDPNWRFYAVRTSDDLHAPTKGWYISDLKKLRQARIIPVGWELAAEKFVGTSLTLAQVMGSKPDYSDGFNGKGPDGVCGTEDDTAALDKSTAATTIATSYCGLVDPNWVLRAPAEQCRLQGYGQQLQGDQGANRAQVCVDVQHCIAENDDGSCQAWGYCTEEKNVWRLGGDSCEAPAGSGSSPWGTCQSFTSASGTVASYLSNSLAEYDTGVCTEAAGCKWYSTSFNQAATTQVERYSQSSSATANVTDLSISPNSARLYLKNLDTYACDSTSEGCHTFLRLTNITYATPTVAGVVARVTTNTGETYGQYATVETVHLKEAPAYLAVCRDTNPSNDVPECKNYLSFCTAQEAGCELYTPKDSSPGVPAIVDSGDTCPAECVGLNHYQQVKSFFDAAAPAVPDSFIPSSAQQCTAAASGCEEFTNVEAGEHKEYYTELRQCVKPDDKDSGGNLLAHTYYTWVGSDLTGYQLKTWQLESLDAANADAAPRTTDSSGDCSATGGPDCKQFYTSNGNHVYYRLESKVVYASATCNRYRRTGGTSADCTASGGAWDGSLNACFYRAIPQQGKLCIAQYAGCREYRGPTAGNVRMVFPLSTFGENEPGVASDATPTSGWQGGTNSNESISAFGHSYLTNGTAITKDVSGMVTRGKQYVLTFWAKQYRSASSSFLPTALRALIERLQPAQAQAAPYVWSLSNTPFVPTADWTIFTLGPVTFDQDSSNGVTLQVLGSSRFYIDNISLKEVQDTFFVKRNSWVTPASCVGTGTVQNPQYLRCSAYTNRAGQAVSVTQFSQLCRVEAVGCEAMVDTHNSDSPQLTQVTVGGQTVTTPADQVAYRVYDTTKACPASAEACTRVGEPHFSSSGAVTQWGDQFVRLDPDSFDPANPQTPLCGVTQNRCQAYTDASGTQHFFKDPGSQVCEYRQPDPSHGFDWYKKGTSELCNLVANPSFEQYGAKTGVTNSGTINDAIEDDFVGWGGTAGGKLYAVSSLNGMYWQSVVAKVDPVAAGGGASTDISLPAGLYTAYAQVYLPAGVTSTVALVQTGGGASVGGDNSVTGSSDTQGHWNLVWNVFSVGSTATVHVSVTASTSQDFYLDQVQVVRLGDVGALTNQEALQVAEVPYAYQCPGDKAGCTAYRDPTLTQRTYYYLANSKLDTSSCAGQVSEKGGCLLFNDLSSAHLSWNANASYAVSQAQNDKAVSPVASDPNDTNLVLKVRRDRTCGEWLACKNGEPTLNPQNKQFDTICYDLGRCDQLAASGSQGPASCAHWLLADPARDQPLTASYYAQQPKNWSSAEFSGYSIPDMYPIDTLSQKDYSPDPQVPNFRLTHLDTNPAHYRCGGVGASCATRGALCADNTVCMENDQGLDGNGPGASYEHVLSKQCRLYPEADAPFPAAVVRDWTTSCVDDSNLSCALPAVNIQVPKALESGFKDANTCQNNENCECTYQRATYSSGQALFYGITSQPKPLFTTDLDNFGQPVQSRLRRDDYAFGLRGYCLEKDASVVTNAGSAMDNACITWFPLDVVGGETSIYDFAPEAGFQGSAFFCSAARGNKSTVYNSYYFRNHEGADCLWSPATSCSAHCGVVGSDNFYCGDNSRQIEAVVVTAASFPIGAGGDEGNYQKSDLTSITVNFWVYDGDGWGGTTPTVQTVQLNDSNDWCYGGSSVCATMPATSLIGASVNTFGRTCVEASGNWAQIRAVFDPVTKLFKGFNAVACDGSPGTGATRWQTIFNIRELCSQVVQTADAVTNKAWTDRLLRNKNFEVAPTNQLGFSVQRSPAFYGLMSTGTQGSLPLVVTDKAGHASGYDVITTPYSCQGNCGGSSPGMCIAGAPSKIDTPCSTSSDCDAVPVDPQNKGVCTGYFSGRCGVVGNFVGDSCITNSDCGAGKTCGAYQSMAGPTPPPPQPTEGRTRLDQIFANELDISQWNNVSWEPLNPDNRMLYDVSKSPLDSLVLKRCVVRGRCSNNSSLSCNDNAACGFSNICIFDCTDNSQCPAVSNTCSSGHCTVTTSQTCSTSADCLQNACSLAGVPEAPEVRQVQLNAASHQLSEGPTGFSLVVNGQRSQSNPATSISINSGDAVSIIFYAYNPNGEQMPLKRVRVYWGDDTSRLSGPSDGKLKNRKHICQPEQNCPGGICSANPLYNWGDSPQACIQDTLTAPGYFNFTHVYTCAGPGDPHWNVNSCNFRPSVFVQDNWGWCHGSNGAQWEAACGGGSNPLLSGNNPNPAWLQYGSPSDGIKVRP